MDISISSLEGQLDKIVSSVEQASPSTPPPKKTPEPINVASPELVEYNKAVEAGSEVEYLDSLSSVVNVYLEDLGVSVSFKIEASDFGGYVVKVVDEQGNVLKTIPGEKFVETHEKIKEQIKGLVEDSKN